MGTRFILEVDMDNAAFEDGSYWELSLMLADLAQKMREISFCYEYDEGKLLDSNGNTVGAWSVAS
jgi:hypothetical protein